jgi:hypothetical protein
MLITSQFVVLNLPKTGSSFVRAVLKRIHRRRRILLKREPFLVELMMPREGSRLGGKDQHGTISQIPERYQHLPVMSVVRNPYDKLMSAYLYRWWARRPPMPVNELRRSLPTFPDLTLNQFVAMWDIAAGQRLGGENPFGIGHQTLQFVRFFFSNPEAALRQFSDEYVEKGTFKEDLGAVTLLRQESLRDDLTRFLGSFGYTETELEICGRHQLVNVTKASASEGSAWTPEALKYVAEKERHLLGMLRKLGISYAPPSELTHR